MWRELVQRVCLKYTFAPPASEQALRDIEAALGVAAPSDLRALLLESNGIGDKHGDGVLSAEQILARNLYLRSDSEQDDLYMPFDHLLCFADAGNGDLFFFPIQGDGAINHPDVFVWEHETDSRRWIAGSLEQFVGKWYSGQIAV